MSNIPQALPSLSYRLILSLAISFLITGCVGYQLGPTNGLRAGSRSIQVNIFQNETIVPRLTTPITQAVRDTLQQDGTFRLETHGEGDIIVQGTILHYRRSALSFDPTDIITARDYDVTVAAKVIARERLTGRVLLDEIVKGRTSLRSGPDLTSAERQAVPILAQDLARNITSRLVDGSW